MASGRALGKTIVLLCRYRLRGVVAAFRARRGVDRASILSAQYRLQPPDSRFSVPKIFI